jgi:hypothetical protein
MHCHKKVLLRRDGADLTWLRQKTASNAGVRGGRLSAVERSPNCWPRGAAFLVPRLSAVACPVMEREPEVANCLRLFNRSYTPLAPKAFLAVEHGPPTASMLMRKKVPPRINGATACPATAPPYPTACDAIPPTSKIGRRLPKTARAVDISQVEVANPGSVGSRLL